MKAIINTKEHTGKIRENRKEDAFYQEYAVMALFTQADLSVAVKTIIAARFYRTKTRVYCCVWISGNETYISGGGYAGGYGYHKASAALEAALNDAGVKLDQSINAAGDSAMEDALIAVMQTLGYAHYHLHVAHA